MRRPSYYEVAPHWFSIRRRGATGCAPLLIPVVAERLWRANKASQQRFSCCDLTPVADKLLAFVVTCVHRDSYLSRGATLRSRPPGRRPRACVTATSRQNWPRNPSKRDVMKAAGAVSQNDSPILASALRSSDYRLERNEQSERAAPESVRRFLLFGASLHFSFPGSRDYAGGIHSEI
jgi:hypothetical protein